MQASQSVAGQKSTGFGAVLCAQEPRSNEQRIFAPKSESELLAIRNSAGPRRPDLPADRIEDVAPPDVSAVPAPEPPFHTFRWSLSGPSVAVSVALALISGIGVGAAWAWKSPPISAAAPGQISHSEFASQLNVIVQDLSSLKQDLKELAARQEQLAAAQARLLSAQEQTIRKPGTVEQIKSETPRPAKRARR